MRLFTLMLAGLGCLGPAMAIAQEQPQVPRNAVSYRGLSTDDMNAYCFWNGQLFSIGATFCTRQASVAVCTETPGKRPTWVNKDNDKFCDKNTSTTPQ
jgi:hypothetical protein